MSQEFPVIDHTIIARLLATGRMRWEPFTAPQANPFAGELCFNGIRHSTELDMYGVPMLTQPLRAAIVAESTSTADSRAPQAQKDVKP